MLRSSFRLLSTVRAAPSATASVHAAEPAVDYAEATRAVSSQKSSTSLPVAGLSDAVTNASSGLPAYHSETSDSSPFTTKTTRTVLKNGLTVITQDSIDNVDHFGFFLKAGPAYLSPIERGYAQILAYSLLHTNKASSTFAIIKAFAANQSLSAGRIVGRQLIGLTADGLVEDPAYLLETFTNALFMPAFQKWEIKESLKFYKEHYAKVTLKETPAPHVQDLIFKAAFGNSSLGEPTIIPPHVLDAGVDVDRLATLWQRTCNLDSIAFVGSSTWTHSAIVDKVQHNEDILRNESSFPQPLHDVDPFVGGTVIDFKPRSKWAYEHGNTAAFGGLGFDAAGEDDATAAAATRVLAQHPAFRALRGVNHNDAAADYTGFGGQGLLNFVTSAGNAAGLRDVHAHIQQTLADVANGRGLGSIGSMQLAAANAQASRSAAVDALALQWANGVTKTVSFTDVKPEDVMAAAKRAVASKPAVVYHGDVAELNRESLVV